jgi:hypothetical protein
LGWFKVDDGFWSHPKTLQLSAGAVALWVRSGSWSCQQLTDGIIPSYTLPMFGADESQADELIGVGYWYRHDGGYEFHDWAEYQEASEAVKERRRKNAEKMRRWREAKLEKASSNAGRDQVTDQVTDPVSNALPDPTRPDPSSSSYEEETNTDVVPEDDIPKGTEHPRLLPKPFLLTASMKQWAATNVPHVDIAAVTAEFVGYWREGEGKGKRKKNWEQTWRNWMKKQPVPAAAPKPKRRFKAHDD